MARAAILPLQTDPSRDRCLGDHVRALLSVDDKTGLVAFARGLQEIGWELIATDGTRAALAAEGITARSVEDVTGSPVLLAGRAKTLHPKIHAAILARPPDARHAADVYTEGVL